MADGVHLGAEGYDVHWSRTHEHLPRPPPRPHGLDIAKRTDAPGLIVRFDLIAAGRLTAPISH
jgi:hypothetical protein